MPKNKIELAYYNDNDKLLQKLVGKQVKHVERCFDVKKQDSILMMIYFTDGTSYLLTPHTEIFNPDFEKIIVIEEMG